MKVVSLDIIAKLDDGFIDLDSLNEFPVEKISQVVQELMESEVGGEYVKRYRVPWVEWESDVEMPINLDGEPISTKKIRFEVLPAAIKMVLPENCPMISPDSD